MQDHYSCPLCKSEAKIESNVLERMGDVDCPSCGSYSIRTDIAADIVHPRHPNHARRYILSGLAREAFERSDPLRITAENVQNLLDSAPISSNPMEAMDRVLLYLSNKQQMVAEFLSIQEQDYPIIFAKHPSELTYCVSNLKRRGLIEYQVRRIELSNYEDSTSVRLTPNGWQRVLELRKTERDSNQAFVAMWFKEQLTPIYDEAFKPALEFVGYDPIRIDLVPHNGKICDRIVAEIRRSGLLVADMTGNRGGVYFEAGFAMGLGIPVIWTCHKSGIRKVHFDTRQFNHIVWTDPTNLKQELIDRIEATIPGRVRRPQKGNS